MRNVFFLIALFSSGVTQDGLSGYQNYLFGMSKQEILEEIKKSSVLKHNSDSELYSIIYTVTYENGFFLDNEVNRWDFSFYENKFYSLHLEIITDTNSVGSIYNKISHHFSKMYGHYLTKKNMGSFNTCLWYIKNNNNIDDVIELNVWKYKKYSISIHFSQGKTLDIVSKQINQKDREKMEFR